MSVVLERRSSGKRVLHGAKGVEERKELQGGTKEVKVYF